MLIRNLKRFKFESFLLLFAFTYVVTQTNKGIWVPEEAPFMDYGWITRAMFSSAEIRAQVSFNEQFSMVFPWGIISNGIYGIGLSVVTHFYIMLFIRTASLVLVAKALFGRFSNSYLSSIMSIAFFAVPTVRYGLTYAHWWSHLILIMSLLLFFSHQERYSNFQLWVWPSAFVLFTISIWANIPHLITAWFVLPVGMLIHFIFNKDLSELRRRTIAVCCVAFTAYVLPLFLYVENLRLWANIDQKQIFSFRGVSIIKVLQGFGGWFYFEKGCLEAYCFYYDYSNFDAFSFPRQSLRIGFFLLAALLPFLYLLRFSLSKYKNLFCMESEKRLAFLSLVTTGFFGLSILGNFDFYWELREKFPLFLGYFRDPYHKFSPTYIVFLYWLVSVFIYQISSQFGRIKQKSIYFALSLLAVYLVAPAMYRLDTYNPDFANEPIGQIRNDDWNEIENDLESFEKISRKWCVVDFAGFRAPIAFAQAKFAESMSNSAFLRTLTINDALVNTSGRVDRDNFCDQTEAIPTLVTRTPFRYMLNTADVGGLLDGSVELPEDGCVQKSTKYFLFLSERCLTILGLNVSNSEQKVLSLSKDKNYELLKSSDVIWVQKGENLELTVAKRDDGAVYSVEVEVVPAFGPLAPPQAVDIFVDDLGTTLKLEAGNKYLINRSLPNGKILRISSKLPCMVPSQVYTGSPDGRSLCFGVTRVNVRTMNVGG